MANQKISALTGATTPLAGTEVLPIVQSGTTKKVSVADLTAGRAISASGVSTKGVSISNTAGVYTAIEQYYNDPGALGNYGNALFVYSNSNPSSYFQRLIPIRGGYANQMGWRLTINNAGTEQNAWTADWNGNVTIDTGNLIQGTAAKGINFTANSAAAGMTSQLLNYYEEGTYTATLTPGTSGTITVNSSLDLLKYTRVGRLVTVTGRCSVSSVSSPVGGTVALNLPIAISTSSKSESRIGGAVSSYNNVTTVNYAFIGDSGATSIDIYVNAASIAAGMSFSVSFSYCV